MLIYIIFAQCGDVPALVQSGLSTNLEGYHMLKIKRSRFVSLLVTMLFIGFVAGIGSSAPAASPGAKDKNVFPRSVPAQARTTFAAEAGESPVNANVYTSFAYNYLTEEYETRTEVYDPTAQYGWSECPASQCGRVVVGKGGKLRLALKPNEQLVYAGSYYSSESSMDPYGYSDFSLNAAWDTTTRLPFSTRTMWLGKRYTVEVSYAGASFYNPAFPAPEYPPYEGLK